MSGSTTTITYMMRRPSGLAARVVVPLVLGVAVVIAIAAAVVFWLLFSWERTTTVSDIARWTDERTLREQELFEDVERHVRGTKTLFVARTLKGIPGTTPITVDAEGAGRFTPEAGEPLVSAFLRPSEIGRAGAAEVSRACDVLRDVGPLSPDATLIIASPGRWFAGWGAVSAEQVHAMLPDDPVLLPAETELLEAKGEVRWSRTYFEPGSGRWLIAAGAVVVLADGNRVMVAQTISADALLERATHNQIAGSETAVIDASGRLLADSRMAGAIHASDGRLNASAADPQLARVVELIASDGPPSEVVNDAQGVFTLGVSRFPGPGWRMVTIHPTALIQARAYRVAAVVLAVGVVVLLGQIAVMLLVILRTVLRPIADLEHATSELAAGGTGWSVVPNGNDEIGRLARSFAAMASAVQAREAELTHAISIVREREALTRAVLDGAADAVLLLVDGRIAEVNQRALTLFAGTPNDLLGRTPAELSPEYQADGRDSVTAGRTASAMTVEAGIHHFPWRHRRCDGTEFEAEVGLARVDLPGATRIIAVVRDVTERNLLEQQLNQARKLESLGQLAGGIAHDFNNMLGIIAGASELLDRSPELSERHRKRVWVIRNTCERAASLVGKLLAFARKGKGSSDVVEVQRLIRDTVTMLEHGMGMPVRITMDLPGEPLCFVGDADQVQNALINLAVNARDAMPAGGNLTISAAPRSIGESEVRQLVMPLAPGTYLDLSVRDSGSGIPPDILQRIFEPFFTTKEVGKGTGLGLSAVYGTVKDHHGSILVDSVLGVGTTFHLLLPLSSALPAPATGVSESHHRGTVLLADDEDGLRVIGREMLEELGWTVIEARDGQQAVERFRTDPLGFSLVILDMEMPRLRGVDVLRAMRQENPAVRAILCCGFARDSSMEQLLRDGFRAVVRKPYGRDDLDAAIAAAMS